MPPLRRPDAAPEGCDLVIHTSASEAGLATALRLAAFEATVLELSWYGAKEVKVPLGGAFHSQRLKLVSSQVGHVAPSHRATWTYRRRLEEALRLLDDPALDALLAPPVAFGDLPSEAARDSHPHERRSLPAHPLSRDLAFVIARERVRPLAGPMTGSSGQA